MGSGQLVLVATLARQVERDIVLGLVILAGGEQTLTQAV